MAIALQLPSHSPVSEAGVQRVVMSPGWQVVFVEHVDWHFTCSVSSTTQWPPETTKEHIAEASTERTAVILSETRVHTSVTSSSGAAPAWGAFAVHVSVMCRSVAMPTQAARTSFSAVLARATRLALAVTNALASPSMDSFATEAAPPLNSSHPDTAAFTLAIAS